MNCCKLQHISIDEFLAFLVYTLEFRTLVMECMSEQEERQQRQTTGRDGEAEGKLDDDGEVEGVLVYTYTLRDLRGVGLAHLGDAGRTIVFAALKIGLLISGSTVACGQTVFIS